MSRPAGQSPGYVPPGPESLGILHSDDWLVVADKPSGLLSVPGRGKDKQVSALSYLEERFGTVLTVHRLDMDTSGLIVFARTGEVQSHLAKQFEARTVTKTYDALVEGEVEGTDGTVNLPIGRNWDERPIRRIDEEAGQPASTRWTLGGTVPQGSHLRLYPLTGRTHQLRVHLAAIGHPILGDRLYGTPKTAGRLCLHASELAFAHPESGNRRGFHSPVPFGDGAF